MLPCDFCLTLNREDEVSKVKEAVIDKSPGYQSFISLLKDLYGCVVEATNICNTCMEKIMGQYTFREKIFKNLKVGSESLTQAKVRNYLNKANEPTSVVIHSNILSIIPNSKKELFEDQVQLQNVFCPRVSLDRLELEDIEDYKKKLKEEAMEYETPDPMLGIFGDDFHSFPSTSTKKRSSSSLSTEGSIIKRAIVVKEEIKEEEVSNKEISRDQFEELLQPLPTNSNESHVNSSRLIDCTNTSIVIKKEKSTQILKQKSKTKKTFICQKCGKVLLSPHALSYHTINLHENKEISKETIWVSKKVKEGRRKSSWHCSECTRFFISGQALRAHLKLHYAKMHKDDNDNYTQHMNSKL